MWVDITMIRSTECYILQGRLGGGGVWICTFNNQFQPLEISAICLQYHYRNATEMRGNSLKIIHLIIVYCVDIKHHMPAAQTFIQSLYFGFMANQFNQIKLNFPRNKK